MLPDENQRLLLLWPGKNQITIIFTGKNIFPHVPLAAVTSCLYSTQKTRLSFVYFHFTAYAMTIVRIVKQSLFMFLLFWHLFEVLLSSSLQRSAALATSSAHSSPLPAASGGHVVPHRPPRLRLARHRTPTVQNSCLHEKASSPVDASLARRGTRPPRSLKTRPTALTRAARPAARRQRARGVNTKQPHQCLSLSSPLRPRAAPGRLWRLLACWMVFL